VDTIRLTHFSALLQVLILVHQGVQHMDTHLEKWRSPQLAITSKFKAYLLDLDQEKRDYH